MMANQLRPKKKIFSISHSKAHNLTNEVKDFELDDHLYTEVEKRSNTKINKLQKLNMKLLKLTYRIDNCVAPFHVNDI